MQLDRLRRREFISLLGGAAAWPLATRAQPLPMPVVGYLSSASPEGSVQILQFFRDGLSEAGYVEDQNVAIEYRWARDKNDQLPALASDLVQRQVALIVTAGGTQTAQAAKGATTTIPIVFLLGSDPVEVGLVASFNRPGGNMTGITIVTVQLLAKRLELVRELVPTASVIGLLVNPANPNAESAARDLQTAARVLGQQVLVLGAGTENELFAVFSDLVKQRVGALIVTADPFFTVNRRELLIALAIRHAIPTVYSNRETAIAGGMISYGASQGDSARQVGLYAGRILKGAKPADLPVLQPTKFELVINLRTAKVIGLEVPPMLLARADEVVE
jgi:putative ABC transport system substrate-binding protein